MYWGYKPQTEELQRDVMYKSMQRKGPGKPHSTSSSCIGVSAVEARPQLCSCMNVGLSDGTKLDFTIPFELVQRPIPQTQGSNGRGSGTSLTP